MTQDDLARLRQLALAATPGPWSTRAERNCPRAIIIAGAEQIADAGEHTHWTDEQCATNAAFIAAANPTTVLALLGEVDKRDDEIARVSAWADRLQEDNLDLGKRLASKAAELIECSQIAGYFDQGHRRGADRVRRARLAELASVAESDGSLLYAEIQRLTSKAIERDACAAEMDRQAAISEDLRRQLSTLRAALEEACDIGLSESTLMPQRHIRLRELRKAGRL